MNVEPDKRLTDYYRDAETWAADKERSQRRSQTVAWSIAGVATVVALFEAAALVALTPLKTVEPYTLLVDRQTGYVQALKPLERSTIAPDTALTRSLLAQYVIGREGFDIDSLKEDYRKVALWSVGAARDQYVAKMQASNPESPLVRLPRRAIIEIQIRSISSLSNGASLVRFSSARTDPNGRPQPPMSWAAVVNYQFSTASMSAADRLLNPLGFQVTRYRRDAELPPPEVSLVEQSASGVIAPRVPPMLVTPPKVQPAR